MLLGNNAFTSDGIFKHTVYGKVLFNTRVAAYLFIFNISCTSRYLLIILCLDFLKNLNGIYRFSQLLRLLLFIFLYHERLSTWRGSRSYWYWASFLSRLFSTWLESHYYHFLEQLFVKLFESRQNKSTVKSSTKRLLSNVSRAHCESSASGISFSTVTNEIFSREGKQLSVFWVLI